MNPLSQFSPIAVFVILFIGVGILSILAAKLLQTAYRWTTGRDLSYGDAYLTCFIGYLMNTVVNATAHYIAGGAPGFTSETLPITLGAMGISLLVLGAVISLRHELGIILGCLIAFLMQILLFVALFALFFCCGMGGGILPIRR